MKRPSPRRPRGLWLLASAVLIGSTAAEAEPSQPKSRTSQVSSEELFKRAVSEISSESLDASIADFEVLADRGFVHPDVSYDRGLAYASRAHSKEERPGDLGSAAAAFEETTLLRPGDKEAEKSLDLVRSEVTRRRARRAKDDVVVRPSLDRLVVGLASEETWSIVAVASSLVLALGLLLRRRPAGMVHVAGSVFAPVALLGLVATVPLAFGARYLREHRRPGVIIVPEASFVDDAAKKTEPSATASRPDAVPEASSVEVGDVLGDNVLIRWGSFEGYVPLASVRVLERLP